jgi:hypothetical protein
MKKKVVSSYYYLDGGFLYPVDKLKAVWEEVKLISNNNTTRNDEFIKWVNAEFYATEKYEAWSDAYLKMDDNNPAEINDAEINEAKINKARAEAEAEINEARAEAKINEAEAEARAEAEAKAEAEYEDIYAKLSKKDEYVGYNLRKKMKLFFTLFYFYNPTAPTSFQGGGAIIEQDVNDRNNPSPTSITTEYRYLSDLILHQNFEDCVKLGDSLPDTPYTIHLAIFSLDWSCHFDQKAGPLPFLKFLVERPAAGEMVGFAKMEYSCVGDTEENERNFKCVLYDRILDVLCLSIKGGADVPPVPVPAQEPRPLAVEEVAKPTKGGQPLDDEDLKDKCERMGEILDSFYRGLISETADGKTTILALFDYDAIDRVVGSGPDAVFERNDAASTIYPITDENVGSALQWAIVDELVFNKKVVSTPVNPDISRIFAKHDNLWNIVKSVPFCNSASSDSTKEQDCVCKVVIDFPFAVYNLEEVPTDAIVPETKGGSDPVVSNPVAPPSAPKFRSVSVSPIFDKEGAKLREEGIPKSDAISLFPAVQLNNYGKEDEYDSRYCFSIVPVLDAAKTSSSLGPAKRYVMFAWKPTFLLDDGHVSSDVSSDASAQEEVKTDAEAADAAMLAKMETNTIYFRMSQSDKSYVVWGIRNNNQFSAL